MKDNSMRDATKAGAYETIRDIVMALKSGTTNGDKALVLERIAGVVEGTEKAVRMMWGEP